MKSTAIHFLILSKLLLVAYTFNTILFSLFRQEIVLFDDYFLPTFTVVLVMWISNLNGYWNIYDQIPSTKYSVEISSKISPSEIKELIEKHFTIKKYKENGGTIILKVSKGWNSDQIIKIDSLLKDSTSKEDLRISSSTPFKLVDAGINYKGIQQILVAIKHAELQIN